MIAGYPLCRVTRYSNLLRQVGESFESVSALAPAVPTAFTLRVGHPFIRCWLETAMRPSRTEQATGFISLPNVFDKGYFLIESLKIIS